MAVEEGESGPAAVLGQPVGDFDESPDAWRGAVDRPDELDRQCRRGRCERDEGDTPRELVAERFDDQADAAPVGDVAPHGGTGGLLVAPQLEPGIPAGGDDGVVVAGRHGVGPELDRLARQRGERYVLLRGQWMVLRHGGHERLLPERVLVEASSRADMWRQREIDSLVGEQPLDVLREDLPRPHLQLGMLGRQGIDQRRQRLVHGGERVREPQRSHLTPRRGLRSLPDAVGGVERSQRLLDERLTGRGQLDALVGSRRTA